VKIRPSLINKIFADLAVESRLEPWMGTREADFCPAPQSGMGSQSASGFC